MKSSWIEATSSRSTSVDFGTPWSSQRITQISLHSEDNAEPGNACCRPSPLRGEDAIYPVLTGKLLAEYGGHEAEKKGSLSIAHSRKVDPAVFMNLHKIITVGKFAVYYFGTENVSGCPRILKIFRPAFGFVGRSKAANRRLKLTDYNYCINKRSLTRWASTLSVRTTNFIAPELFTHNPYSRQTDIWALGVIFYRMTSGRFPFYGCSPKDLKQKIMTATENYTEFFTDTAANLCSRTIYDPSLFIVQMLQKNPGSRLGHKIKTEDAFRDEEYFMDTDWNSAHYQMTNGPPIEWKFPVGDSDDIEMRISETLTYDDVESFDLSKMKVKPLRLDALRDGMLYEELDALNSCMSLDIPLFDIESLHTQGQWQRRGYDWRLKAMNCSSPEGLANLKEALE
ncbi:protein kinase c [Plakobranchus ocellatus]|uniref:non-specific serine/threonine protein kinase n=1 Tax=Plakobranchus ocellatus TaxID=259542 RepID=A0AAV3Y244_9GAST|nr:protein kinase c [Plakobranchus ocellatus]